MEDIQPYLTYFEHHPDLAIIVIFLIAFGEALLIIGLFVPSTVVLVGAGVLVGSGHLPFWPVFIASTVGAFAGDQISYWAGRIFGDRLKGFWPLSRYPQLVEKGENFVREHGGKSIAIGRFVPGVKAVVPGIVGMLGMGQTFFFTVNFLSSIVWSAAHILPGVLAGQGLSLAGDLSGRLAVVLVELLVILFLAGWVIRVVASTLSPYLDHLLGYVSDWAKRQKYRPLHAFGEAISPENPRAMLVVLFILLVVLGLIAFTFIMSGVMGNNAFTQTDHTISNIMRNLRNAPADAFMIPLTMFGDAVVLVPVMVTIVAWLLWQRAWKAAGAATFVFVVGKTISTILKMEVHRLRPMQIYSGLEGYSFPSGHTTSAALTFGVLAVLVTRTMNRWSGSLVYVMCGLVVIVIAYTRIYLGVHWMSDTLGGLVYGLIVVAGFGIAIEALPPRRMNTLGLLAVAVCVFITAGLLNINFTLPAQEAFYSPPQTMKTVSQQQWQTEAWKSLPENRIDIAGKREEKFSMQWAGSLEELKTQLTAQGWRFAPKWAWHDSLSYLDTKLPLDKLAPRPVLHEGLQAKLTMTLQGRPENPERLVVRAYSTTLQVQAAAGPQPVYLVSITNETLQKKLGTYVVPILSPLRDDQWQAIRQQMLIIPTLAATWPEGSAMPLVQPKSLVQPK